MRYFPLIALALFACCASGCGMAAPGVASLGAKGDTTVLTDVLGAKASNFWVNQPGDEELIQPGSMSIDISEREIGKSYRRDEDGRVYESAAALRQAERAKERRKRMAEAMGFDDDESPAAILRRELAENRE